MPRKIAAAAVGILLGLTASPVRADDLNYLESDLLEYDTGLYGIGFYVGKKGTRRP